MSQRQKRRDQRKREFWDDKLAQARTPEQRAAVEYDRIRSEIRRLPADQRDQAWQRLAARLAETRIVTERQLHT